MKEKENTRRRTRHTPTRKTKREETNRKTITFKYQSEKSCIKYWCLKELIRSSSL